ncbi:nuclear transport factor 2 family protein [Pseudenhygromyxa sp. WMMC2535]|uniref:nuclear transport factor 2 family protein n=1 Tax=Pseudenhygromyxa sp. WMMC2535 TaxID=2712867 RepID=UPI0015553A72|nr:nuclear transport factor 2 family protein [Pseudenhygromyxa sp. WMMC2535]NVB41351.1 nuclear transport factor 2 family protein [Pseudenhygromyxa sp. WMMC2535]
MSDSLRLGINELLRANREFYRAFAAGDFVAMDRIWADHAASLCIHPGWALLRGRDRVMASWRDILRRPPQVRARDEVAELLGEVGVVICTELLPGVELVATNVFVREEGRWRLLHHQAGMVAQDDDDVLEDEERDEHEDRLLN